MDDFNSLIPLQEDDKLLFQYTIPTINPCLDHPNIHQDLLNHGASSLASHQEAQNEVAIINNKGKRQQKPSITQDNTDDKKHKKAAHRDIERQRRQEMATLYASLRNLLPLEYIKGKRSISDHVHEAVNYIKHMEDNIRELEVKRANIRKLLGGSDPEVKNVEARNSSPIDLTVRSCSEGSVEVLIKNGSEEDWFPLSSVLDVLLEEGLTVVSCVCTKVDKKFLCTIQTEASHMTDVDLFFLQEKLTDKVITWKNLAS